MSDNKNNKWIRLAKMPYNRSCQPIINLNANEFLTTPPNNSETPIVFKYNTNHNKFTEIAKYNINYHNRSAFNKIKQELYLYNGNKYQIDIIPLKDNQDFTIQTVAAQEAAGYFLFIDGHFHIFLNHHRHWIGIRNNKTMNTLHNTLSAKIASCDDGRAIYISSKKMYIINWRN